MISVLKDLTHLIGNMDLDSKSYNVLSQMQIKYKVLFKVWSS